MVNRCWEAIASQCAPVLMDVKPSNLLILTKEEEQEFLAMEMIPDISCQCLYTGEKKSIWLLYRRDALEAVLVWPQVRSFLRAYGYKPECEMVTDMLERLTKRFSAYKEGRMEFPHELGIYLGYPLEDVKGFIEHQGKNYLCSGYWKVYKNENRAKMTFKLYETVRSTVLELLSAGVALHDVSCFAY